jgi:ribose transport system ATP-binding protein
LPEDRKAQGLVLGLPVLHNVSLASLSRFTRFGFLRSGLERRTVGDLVEKLRVRTPGLEQLARNLSGGNQQKLVIAKWLAVEPRVIIFDEPTRGIDVGAKFEVYRLITALAAQGTAIILISSDLPEVLGLSHRVAVMRQGRLAGILPRRSATPVAVMRRAMGVAEA